MNYCLARYLSSGQECSGDVVERVFRLDGAFRPNVTLDYQVDGLVEVRRVVIDQ
jgi:hypothetical protein